MKVINGEILYIIFLSILMIISMIISFKRKKRNELAGRFLIFFVWALWYYTLMAFLVLFNKIHAVPHLIRTGYLVSMMILPASYFYVLQTLNPRPLRISDLIHLAPAMVYLIDYFPFFILSGDSKISIIEQLNDTQLSIGFAEGWFMPQYGHFVIRSLLVFAYCIAQLLIVRKVYNTPEHPVRFGTPTIIRWLLFLVLAEFFAFNLPVLAFFSGNPVFVAASVNIVEIVVSLILGLYLIFQPEILYGTSEYFQQPQAELNRAESSLNADKSAEGSGNYPEVVSESALNKLESTLEVYMQAHKPFLQPGYKLIDLSNDTGIPIYKISAYVNRRKNLNFFGYLNHYRVDYCLEKFAAEEYKSKTLEAIGEECGFQNRTTFIRVFKSVTGMSPTEYIRNH